MLPVLCVIPARYGAQRFPGKPLADLLGKPVIQWVWEAAKKIQGVDEVLVATDDDRIRRAVEGFGGAVAMTPASCPSGSDRIAAALAGRDCAAIVNVQGDEPLMRAGTVARALRALLEPHAQRGRVGGAGVDVETVDDDLLSEVVAEVASDVGQDSVHSVQLAPLRTRTLRVRAPSKLAR